MVQIQSKYCFTIGPAKTIYKIKKLHTTKFTIKNGIWLNQRCINVQQYASLYIKGLFFFEFGLEGID